MARTKGTTKKAAAKKVVKANRKPLPHTMTVRELIEALEDFDDDTPVLLTSDYGDHCHTEQALGIDEVEQVEVEENAYSDSGFAVRDIDYRGPDRDEDDDEDEGPATVIALRPANRRGGW